MKAAELEACLTDRLSASVVKVEDQSHRHKGHSGPRQTGGGHYEALIVSDVFKELTPVARHRLVYEKLRKEMKTEIHALSLKLLTPEEFEKLKGAS